MTDPLRPLSQLVRALLASHASRLGKKPPPGIASSDPQPPAERGSLQSRLLERIAPLDPENLTKMRETFVELVLLHELGEHLARDPAFHEMVRSISEQLATHPEIAPRLHLLLLQLSQRPSSLR